MYTTTVQTELSRTNRPRSRRRAALLCKKTVTMVSACLILILSLCILSGFSSLPKEQHAGRLYYKTVTVQSNDTLWGIASSHVSDPYTNIPSYIHDIKKLNNMHSDKIYYGQKLLIPYYSSDLK